MKIIELITKSPKPFYSLEFFPPKDKENLDNFIQTASKLKVVNPLFASVTYGAGGSNQERSFEIIKALKDNCAFTVMSHLTCVGSSKAKIHEYLKQLKEAGIDNILALRGDAPADLISGTNYDWSKAEFKSSLDLVEYIKSNFSEFGIAVSGYPAPHPESPSFGHDRDHTAKKLKIGGDFAITQLFFDVREYIDLVETLKAQNVQSPVIPGVLPIQSFSSLKHILKLCGANIPAKLYLDLEEADRKGGAEAVKEAGLKFAIKQIKKLIAAGAPGIHLYTLNQAESCIQIINEAKL